jgi:hypothetical protein
MRNIKEESLDPDDWEATRAVAHRMVDEAVERLCCANQLTNGSPLSPDGFTPRLS